MKNLLTELLLNTEKGKCFYTEIQDNNLTKPVKDLNDKGIRIKTKTSTGWFTETRTGDSTKLTKVTIIDNEVNE